MIVDGHRHVVEDSAPILAQMDALGIQRTVLVGIGVRDLGVVTIRDNPIFRSHVLLKTIGMWKARRLVRSRALQEGLLGEPRNDAVLRAIRERPDRFSGFCFVNPESPRAAEEIRRCLDAGMRGIKLALVQYPTDLNGPKMAALCEIARERHVPIFIHPGLAPESSDLSALVRRFGAVPFIVAHMAVQCFHETLELAKECRNVFIDTSSFIATRAKIQRACDAVGPERILFGTDLPVMCRDPQEAMAKIFDLNVSDHAKKSILGDNLRELLDLS